MAHTYSLRIRIRIRIRPCLVLLLSVCVFVEDVCAPRPVGYDGVSRSHTEEEGPPFPPPPPQTLAQCLRLDDASSDGVVGGGGGGGGTTGGGVLLPAGSSSSGPSGTPPWSAMERQGLIWATMRDILQHGDSFPAVSRAVACVFKVFENTLDDHHDVGGGGDPNDDDDRLSQGGLDRVRFDNRVRFSDAGSGHIDGILRVDSDHRLQSPHPPPSPHKELLSALVEWFFEHSVLGVSFMDAGDDHRDDPLSEFSLSISANAQVLVLSGLSLSLKS
jgi:hypothetical protein